MTRITPLFAVTAVILAWAGLAPGTAFAQDLAGQWQGTLQAGQALRIVFVITAGSDGYRTTMYSIDQGGQGISVSGPAVQNGTVRLSVTAIGGSYEGKLGADGRTIDGAWSQGGGSLPLVLTRATPDTAWALPAPPKPMATGVPARFEVASIRPSNPDAQGRLFTVKGRQVLTINTSLADLVSFAYNVHARQISGGPAWMENERFDIVGQPELEGVPNDAQLREMVRRLLEERFSLMTRVEKRDLPIYAIVVSSGGPKLARNDTNPNGLPSLLFKGLGVLPAVNASMDDFARAMQTAVLDRPVVNRTGLPGRYDFTLRWTPDDSQFRSFGVRIPPSTDPNAPPGLFTAIQEQLGLRLESTNGPADVYVIERAERPSN